MPDFAIATGKAIIVSTLNSEMPNTGRKTNGFDDIKIYENQNIYGKVKNIIYRELTCWARGEVK